MSFMLQILDGQLGLTPPSNAGASIDLGICSDGLVNTLYTSGNATIAASQLGQGPLVENQADKLNVAGGPGYAIPLNPSTVGTVSATSYGGTGTGTVTATRAPHKQIQLKIETGGTNGTMTFRYSVGGAAYSAPVSTTGGTFSYLVPGTLTTVTFASGQTWVTTDVYTISTAGVVTLTGGGPSASNVTFSTSPLDVYDIRVTIVTSGALGAAVFTYSLDGGNTVSGQILVPGGGVYVLPNTGVVLTFAGTFTAHALPYTITTVTASFSTTDVNNAMAVALASAVDWEYVHVIGQASSAANAATMASTLSTHMTTAETNFRYVGALMECPTSESDSTVASAFAAFVDKRVWVCAGDIGHISSLTPGKVTRRNCGIVVSSKISDTRPGTSIAWTQDPPVPIKNVKSLYRDEAATPLLDAARFITMTTKIGVTGYFITHGKTMAAQGSDFSRLDYMRPMNVACRAARAMFLPFEEQTIPVNPIGATNAGKVHEKWAKKQEALAKKKLEAALNIGPGANEDADAQAAEIVIDRNENILSTRKFKIAVRIVPNGKAEAVEVTMGFMNPALAA